jgi:hypothetical protein
MSIIRIPAVLRSKDSIFVTGCVLEIWKEYASSGKAYTRCRLVEEPSELPNGAYIVDIAGHSIRTNKILGMWGLVFLAPDLEI